MTETKTCLADAVSILEVDEGIFIRGKICPHCKCRAKKGFPARS
jgi:hypothetical protein